MKTTLSSFTRKLLPLALFAALAPASWAQMAITTDTSEIDATRREMSPTVASANSGSYHQEGDGLPTFGSQLFQGDFGDLSFSGFNPNYQLGVGDVVQLMIWGALDVEVELTVDAQGNLFIPRVGPVRVLGVRNEDLNDVIRRHIEVVYTNNVESYAHLRSTQTARVFVSGFVSKPGLYEGFSSDSPLYFLDRSGGVDVDRGSYLRVSVLRNQQVLTTVNLYTFLSEGILPATHFRDGDVILVGARAKTVSISGRVRNPARFEFEGDSISLTAMLALASPEADATTVSIRRARGGESEALVVPLSEAEGVYLKPGDEVAVGGRNIARNLLITFTGEHEGKEHVVLPHGSTLDQALALIQPSQLSNLEAVQIYRESVAQRQAKLLQQSLDNLERSVLRANSVSLEEAKLRQVEAETVLAFIARARTVSPRGQILLENLQQANQIHLEDGDIIHIPTRNHLVTVHGEVKYPNTQTFRERETLARYIGRAGGFTESANQREIILIRQNGLIETIGRRGRPDLQPGDEIIVLPEPDKKRLLFAKEISTILYQIALSARVAIGL
jgi:protein involved in polysaccharide export with SLBB domain